MAAHDGPAVVDALAERLDRLTTELMGAAGQLELVGAAGDEWRRSVRTLGARTAVAIEELHRLAGLLDRPDRADDERW